MKKQFTILQVALILMLTCINAGQLAAQKISGKPAYYGFTTDISCSGNGHGAFYGLYINMHKGRQLFSFGPIVQKRTMLMNGFKVSYLYSLTGEPENNYPENTDLLEIDCLVH